MTLWGGGSHTEVSVIFSHFGTAKVFLYKRLEFFKTMESKESVRSRAPAQWGARPPAPASPPGVALLSFPAPASPHTLLALPSVLPAGTPTWSTAPSSSVPTNCPHEAGRCHRFDRRCRGRGWGVGVAPASQSVEGHTSQRNVFASGPRNTVCLLALEERAALRL